MTTEEKVKAYDKALEKAKRLYEQVPDSVLGLNLVGIFPELRESEDERIKKEIIRTLKGELRYTSQEDTDRYVAWLEKQKDTNALIQEASEKAYTEGMRVERKHWLEKQDQKVIKESLRAEYDKGRADACRGWIGEEIGWEDYIKTNADALRKISFKIWNKVQDVPFEQKPAWSEEDEEELGIAIKSLQRAGQWDSATWLKSLKTRLKGE